MAWIETITKEGFQLAIREAMRPEIDKLDRKIERKLEKMESRIGDVEQRVSRLEGTIEGSMRAYEANIKLLFYEFKSELFQRLLNHEHSEQRIGSQV